MDKTKTNKLSIYLIKEDYSTPEDIFRNPGSIKNKVYSENEIFYYGESHVNKPSWLKSFFVPSFVENIELFTSSSSGVYIFKTNLKGKERIFAIAFGYGWQFIRPGICDERFGLITALNIIDPEKLRKIDKKSMVSAPKDTSEQLSKAGSIADFGIDIEQDLVRSVSGIPRNQEIFGKIVTGKDAFSLSVKVDQLKVKELIGLCHERYLSTDYKKDFDWIDQISEVKDLKMLEKLNSQLVANLKNTSLDKTWMAVPEIVEWENITGFRYSAQGTETIYEDIFVKDFLNLLDDNKEITIDLLKQRDVFSINLTDQVKDIWSVYQCLYSEVEDETTGNTFLLSNGKWYQIEKDFCKLVTDNFSGSLSTSSFSLPDYNHENEGKYNEDVPNLDNNFMSLDRKLISIGGKHNKIEFCDLLSKDKKIIHVKHYGQSSVLSHLFFQGLVSGELLLSDMKFRKKVMEKLTLNDFRFFKVASKPKASDFEIVYAIISSSSGSLDIPFFSKVSFKNAKNRLDSFGYNNVSLVKINNIKP
jgi:uncharacterized protein (TIGR04141 family)